MRLATGRLLRHYQAWLVCQRYSHTTLKAYDRVASQFLEFWGNRPLDRVRPGDIQDFLVARSERDLSSDIVRRHIWPLRSFFDFLCLRGLVDFVAPRYVRPRPRPLVVPRALSKENALRLIAAAPHPRDRALLELYYATGCRISELVQARLEHVDFQKRSIWIEGKFGKSRRVFFGSTAETYLKRYLGNRKEGFIFENRDPVQKGTVSWNGRGWVGYWKDYNNPIMPFTRSKYLGGKSMTRKAAWVKFKQLVPNPDKGHIRRKPHALARGRIHEIFRTAAARARLGRVTSHNLRHSFAAHMLDNGADIRHVQELLGHSSVATTHSYSSVASLSTSDAYKQFHPRARGLHEKRRPKSYED
jgi:integrase/recombinase XerD